ncbi:MAG TPA: ABC transporter permease [Anaerolineaceae bacterium]
MKQLRQDFLSSLWIARKSLLEMVREPQMLGLELGLPLLFLAVVFAMYANPLLVTYPLVIYNPANQHDSLLENLDAMRYPDEKRIFQITPVESKKSLLTSLDSHSAAIGLEITPKGTVTILGDPLYARFFRASSLLETVVTRYLDRAGGIPEIVRLDESPLHAKGPSYEYDLYAPGMMVFAILMIIPQTAMLVSRELRWRTLCRLRLTPVSAAAFLSGISLAQMAVAFIQVPVIFLAAVVLGFHNQGSLILAILICLALAFSAIGLGLVTACFSENDSQAANIGSTFTMIQVFLSGALYIMPPFTLFTLCGHQIDLFDLFPATHIFLALQQVLSYGATFETIQFRLFFGVLLSLLYFAGGIILFKRLKMSS